ncbi:MAG TPA: 23S rRNA (pseudouridine(1915)-N(3))-methyltransferase RlmH [Dissulfurispiraceae bacterium]
MKIRIFWIGRTKERYLQEGIDRYLKLLGPLSRVTIVEIKEEKGKAREKALHEEGRRILKQAQAYVLLDERGRELSSEGLAGFLRERGSIDFVIGGPYGVSDEVRAHAGDIVSLSRMTFTHEMVRVLFLEQLYRAMTIIKGKEYHH